MDGFSQLLNEFSQLCVQDVCLRFPPAIDRPGARWNVLNLLLMFEEGNWNQNG
jgi:hypothetical protein